jgi:hypothetical protein
MIHTGQQTELQPKTGNFLKNVCGLNCKGRGVITIRLRYNLSKETAKILINYE